MTRKPNVLVVCTGNSMRSQMAEAVLRHELGDQINVYSAGTSPSRVYPMVIDVLEDAGIDASGLYSKSVNEFLRKDLDLVITVCSHAEEMCPYMPNARKRIHHGYPDPMRQLFDGDERTVFSNLREKIRAELVPLVIRELGLR